MALEYDEVAGWAEDEWARDVTGVAVDLHDDVHVLRRGADAITTLDSAGTVLRRWGDAGLSDRPHLISAAGERIHVADDHGHVVMGFDLAGCRVETIGTGVPADTGSDAFPDVRTALDRMSGGPPFNRPTKAVVGPGGDLFVSDGYRNCRIHRFSAQRELLASWGGSGAALGCFVIPHSVTLDPGGRVAVCDRENDRIQFFSVDGELQDLWEDVQRPTDLAFDSRGNAYVTELARGRLDLPSWRLGPAEHERPGRVTVFGPDHAVLARISPPGTEFLAPHAIAVDSTGAVYVAEVPESFAHSTGRPQRTHRCLRKFLPRNGSAGSEAPASARPGEGTGSVPG